MFCGVMPQTCQVTEITCALPVFAIKRAEEHLAGVRSLCFNTTVTKSPSAQNSQRIMRDKFFLQIQTLGQLINVGQTRAGLWATALAVLLVTLALASPSFAVVSTTQKKASHHKAYRSSTFNSRRVLRGPKWNPLFPGTHDKLVEQNAELDRSQVDRMNTEYDLIRSETSNDLVQVNETEALKIEDSLMDTRRYCRPWTRDFLQDISQAYFNTFHAPLQVNSLVRTSTQQLYLRQHNRFAAPAFGDTASTHLAGVAVDLSRRGLTNAQYQWIRSYLLPLQQKGMVDPIEERQPVLHVVVFEKYSGKSTEAKGSASEASEPTEDDLIGTTGASQP